MSTKIYVKTVNKIYTDFIIKSKNFNNIFDTYKILFDPTFSSASWQYETPDIHKITIGYIHNKVRSPSFKNRISNYLFHEMAHSEFTNRNMKQTLAKLLKAKVDFKFYNLFEDARIEFKWRRKYKYNFTWAKYEYVEAFSADEMFYKIMQNQNQKLYLTLHEKPIYKQVVKYYYKAISIDDEDEMIKLIQMFLKEFNIRKPSDNLSKYKRPKDELTIKQLQSSNKKDREESEKKGSSVVDVLSSSRTSKQNNSNDHDSIDDLLAGIDELEDVIDSDMNIDDILAYYDEKPFILENPINKKDDKLINEIIFIMKRIFKDFIYNEPSYRGKRLNITRVMLDSHKIFNKKTLVKSKKKVQLTLIIDMSESMDIIKYETINIVYSMNQLAKMGYFNIDLILSASVLSTHIKLPCEDEIIDKINFADYGGEGIEKTLKKYTKILQKSSNIIILTDGYLTDDPIDKKYLNSLGIQTLALYIQKDYENLEKDIKNMITKIEYENDLVNESSLLQWFDKSIVKKDTISVIKELANQGIRL